MVNDPQYLSNPTFFSGKIAWQLPNPAQPPIVLWNNSATVSMKLAGSTSVYNHGVIVYTVSNWGFMGINAATGAFMWQVPATSSQVYGTTAINGVFAFGGLDGDLNCWNITTGQLLWTFNAGTGSYNQSSASLASAYGIIYGHNQDTNLYALNATTGKLIWKAHGSGIAYSGILTIAGGYIYCNMGENQYRDFYTGEFGHSQFDCYDAYNGIQIWELPIETGAPGNMQCNAYGNLYLIPTYSSSIPGSFSYANVGVGTGGSEVWCFSNQPQDWPMFMNDPAHTPQGSGPTNLALKWAKTFGAGGYLRSSPAIVNGIGYIGSSDHNIYAFNVNSGNQIWKYTTDAAVRSSVAVVNGRVYTGSDDGNVYCLDAATGSKIWSVPLTVANFGQAVQQTPPSPMIIGSKLYIATLDGFVYCLSTSDGALQWKFKTGGTLYGTPTIVNNVLYVAPSGPSTDPVGHLYEIDATTGTMLMNISLPYALNPWTGTATSKAIYASPTVDPLGQIVFVRAVLGYTYGINATSGQIKWLYNATYNPGFSGQWGTATYSAVLYANGQCYFTDYYSIVCLNALTGNLTWNTYLSRESLSWRFVLLVWQSIRCLRNRKHLCSRCLHGRKRLLLLYQRAIARNTCTIQRFIVRPLHQLETLLLPRRTRDTG